MSKCICLSRVSTGIQDLDQQTEKLLLAAKTNGYSDDDIIVIEDTESGIKLSEEERFGLTKMKKIINSGTVDLVIVYELSRLGRRPDVLYAVRDFLIKHKVQLQVLNPAFLMLKKDGTLDENSNILFSLFGSLAENEMAIKKARFKRGRAKKAAENKFIGGGCLFGYAYDKDKRFYIKEDDAAIIKRIFNEYLEGKRMMDISRDLVRDGSLNMKMASAKFFVQRTLHNESYYGKPLQDQDLYYDLQYPRTYPAIISKELFDEVQKKAKEVKTMPKQYTKYVYLCRGKVFDREGRPFYVNTSSHSYTCNIEFTADNRTTLNVSIAALDELVWDYTKNLLKNAPKKDISEEITEYMIKIQSEEEGLKTLEERLSDTTTQIERIEMRIIKGKLSEIQGEKIEESIESERADIKESIKISEERIASYKKKIDALKENHVTYTDEMLDQCTIEEKRELVLQNIERIVVSKISYKHRLVCIFYSLADTGEFFDLNTHSRTWEHWKIEYH